jgi:sugar phosphate isomerase/epimerase
MDQIPVALQLYSVRYDCARNFPETLQAVARMGYKGVEFAGYHGHSADSLRKILDDLGLRAAGAHVGIDLMLGDRLNETIDYHRVLGVPYLIVPWLGDSYRGSTEAWKQTARTMNAIAASLAPHGLMTGYHNHSFEFVPLAAGGELPWDTFFANTNADVIMQFDTGNAMHAGSEALPFLVRYPGRALSVHLKEYSSSDPNALLGDGDVPFPEIMQACESIGGTRWYVIEQEVYRLPPLECVERCLRNLEKIRG